MTDENPEQLDLFYNRPCKNCGMPFESHPKGKCLFEASSYEPGSETFRSWQAQGIAYGNIKSVQKIKFVGETNEALIQGPDVRSKEG